MKRAVLYGTAVVVIAYSVFVFADAFRRRHRAERTLAKVEASMAKLREQLTSRQANPGQPLAAAALAGPQTALPSEIGWLEHISETPQLQLKHLLSLRPRLAVKYGAFLRAENLPEDRRQEFYDSLSKHVAQKDDLVAVRSSGGLSTTDPAVRQERGRIDAELRAEQIRLLGEEGYARLKDYERAMPVHEFVTQLAGVSVLAGVPFAPEQTERLTRAILASSETYARGGPFKSGLLDLPLAEMHARGILSQEQIRLLRMDNTRPSRSGESVTRLVLKAAWELASRKAVPADSSGGASSE